jgi:predicted nucleotidyltransferase component of viral defense system
MPIRDTYRRQVALLVRLLPLVAEQTCFALKGGTAINLFIRDMPRLSVDIDLTYLPVEPRATSLAAIDAAMNAIARRVRQTIGGVQVNEGRTEGIIATLFVRVQGVQVKIEVTPVLRGSVFDPQIRTVSPSVEQSFGFAEIAVTSLPDLYGGKIVAALDRQHPRDFFDIRELMANEGISDELRKAFLVYLLSHDRPMDEVVAPHRKNIEQEYERGFVGMTDRSVSLAELLDTREALIAAIVGQMPQTHKQLVVAFVKGEPIDWSAAGFPDVSALPAIHWRRRNLDKLSTERRAELAELLAKALAR